MRVSEIAAQQINTSVNAATWGDLIYNVKAFGAKGDGITNDSPAVIAAIAAMPAEGGVLYFPPGTYFLVSTVTANKMITITGSGYSSVITGTASPLITTDQDVAHKFMVRDIKIVTKSSGTGVFINKTWTAGAVTSFELMNVWFYASGNAGTLLRIYGARESGLYNCHFEGTLSWATGYGTAIGLQLDGDNSGGAMNLHYQSLKFLNIYQAVKGYGSATRPDLFAGHHFNNCEAIACFIGLEFANGGSMDFSDGMLDFCKNPVIMRYWGGANIHDNYIACKDETDYAIQIVPQFGTSEEINIHHNGIYTYGTYTSGTMTARGVVIDGTLGNGRVQRVIVSKNFMRNFARAVYIQGKDFTYPGYGNLIEGNDIKNCQTAIYLDTYALYNQIEDNTIDVVTTPFTDIGQRNTFFNNRVSEKYGRNSGTYQVGSTAATYTYQFPHGLYGVPKYAVASAASTQTRDLGQFSVSFDATNIYINYANPTTAGLALKWTWFGEV